MAGEALVAALVGLAALWLVLQPLIKPRYSRPLPPEPLDAEETPKGIALTALKEIEFDRETGKLSQQDYEFLKAKYTATALEALRSEQGAVSNDVEALIAARVRSLRSASTTTPLDPSNDLSAHTSARDATVACATCGPRPEPDAVYCSSCGRRLVAGGPCARCGAPLLPGSRFCEGCGRPVAA
ncbi:MAG TPA: zinc ribbon domain-containing protein [Gemmatimonadales bacterium]|nr:zinc ribbon domain-containing protein [Gemmatimonadales bacterium]